MVGHESSTTLARFRLVLNFYTCTSFIHQHINIVISLIKISVDPIISSNYHPIFLLPLSQNSLKKSPMLTVSDHLSPHSLEPTWWGISHSEAAPIKIPSDLYFARSDYQPYCSRSIHNIDQGDYYLLLEALPLSAFQYTTFSWFFSYLICCFFSASFAGSTSSSWPRLCYAGISCGSVLGPLLFPIHTHFPSGLIKSHSF